MFGRVLAYVVMFFVPIINTRALSVDQYGYYRQFQLAFETLTPLLILGLPVSLQYYLPRAQTQRDKSVYVTQTLTFLFVNSFIAMAVYTVMGEVLGAGMGLMIRSFYWRLSAFTGLMMTSHYMEYLFAAEKEVGRQTIYHASFAIVQAITVMACAWFFREVSAVIWGLTIFACAKFLFAVGYTVVRYRPSFKLISVKTINEQLSFAFPIGLFSIILVLLAQTDKFIINRFMGREAFAIYVIGAFQVPVVNMINQSVRNVTFPLMAGYEREGRYGAIADLWRRTVLKTAVLYFPIFVGLEAVAGTFIRVLYTDTYAAATPIFMIYLLLLFRATLDTVSIIQVFKRTGYLVKVFASGFVVNLVLSIALYRVMGREGVPLATVITMFTITVVNIVYCSRLCQVTLTEFLPVGPLMRRFVVAVIPGVGLWWISRRLGVDSFIGLAALGIAYILVYGALARAAGLINLGDLGSLFGRGRGGNHPNQSS
jgi:O-antigen/teichoic acid export membrane protein